MCLLCVLANKYVNVKLILFIYLFIRSSYKIFDYITNNLMLDLKETIVFKQIFVFVLIRNN